MLRTTGFETNNGALFGNATRCAAEIAIDHAIFDGDRTGSDDRATGNPDSDQSGGDAVEIEIA
jgi:hypothetical protein